jgi:hypothetical protein
LSISTVGNQVTILALPWLVLQLTSGLALLLFFVFALATGTKRI